MELHLLLLKSDRLLESGFYFVVWLIFFIYICTKFTCIFPLCTFIKIELIWWQSWTSLMKPVLTILALNATPLPPPPPPPHTHTHIHTHTKHSILLHGNLAFSESSTDTDVSVEFSLELQTSPFVVYLNILSAISCHTNLSVEMPFFANVSAWRFPSTSWCYSTQVHCIFSWLARAPSMTRKSIMFVFAISALFQRDNQYLLQRMQSSHTMWM